jgi:hypothetical protein
MALNRIRSTNPDFQNAVLTRAHIRVRSNTIISYNLLGGGSGS